MKRIIMMVLRNILFVPYGWFMLCRYARNVDNYTEGERYALLKKIDRRANQGGNITIQTYGVENIPDENGFIFYPNHQGLYENRFRRREHRAADSADLRPVLCIASPQYLFHLFLSGDYEARRRADDFPCAGNLRERPAHFHFTADFRRGSIVVGDARYRTSHVCPRPAAR